jgi:hypothetical protein
VPGDEPRDPPLTVEQLGAEPGLCGSCVHRRLLGSRRSVFLRCALADSDPRFARYPALPVRSCAGYEPEPRSASRGRPS